VTEGEEKLSESESLERLQEVKELR
jgi:hypothetical protein